MSYWSQQFASVTFDQLLAEIDQDSQLAMKKIRDWIAEKLAWKSELVYYDSSWCWAMGYESAQSAQGTLRGLFLIPEPGRARIGISFCRSSLGRIEESSLPKPLLAEIREGVCVRDRVWGELPLNTPADQQSVTDLLDLLSK